MKGVSGGLFVGGKSKTSRQNAFDKKITRAEAKERGLRFYFSSVRCECGNYMRYTSSQQCDTCTIRGRKEKMRAGKPLETQSVSIKTKRSIEDIKESLKPDYWDSLLD